MKFYLTVLLLAISFITPGQQETFRDADSLLKKLSAASTDTARILLKCKLGEAYRANKSDTSLLLDNEALAGSTAKKFRQGEMHALVLLCVMYTEKGELPLALEHGLKALKIAGEEKYDNGQI